MFGVYRNPDLLNKTFDCLLTSIAKVQSVSRKASFLFVGDVNVHHKDWLVSSTTNLPGSSALSFPRHRVVSRWLRSLHTLMKGCLTRC